MFAETTRTLQVVFMTGEHALLLDRAKHRRVDYAANYEPFHLPPTPDPKAKNAATALSPPLLPLDDGGAVDAARVAALKARHDDSEENVRERLRLWDVHVEDVRTSPHHVSLKCMASKCMMLAD